MRSISIVEGHPVVMVVVMSTCLVEMVTALARLVALRGRERGRGCPFFSSSFMSVVMWW